MTVAKWEQQPLTVPSRDIVDGWAHQVAAVAALAARIAGTEFVPKGYRDSDAAVTAAILAGREMGIGPMTALQHLHVIDGRPAMSAQLMRALVFAHGHSLRVVESTSTVCKLAGKRKGDTTESMVVWTIEDARRASITGKPNWTRYPRQMLLARATGELCRVLFPDVIGGMAYTVEEAGDDPGDLDGETPAPTKTVRRRAVTKDTPHPAGAISSTVSAPLTSEQGGGPDTLPPAPPPIPAEGRATTPEPPRPVAVTAATAPLGGELPPLPDDPAPATRPGNSVSSAEQPQQVPQSQPAQPEPTEPTEQRWELLTAPQRAHLFALLTELGWMEPRELRLRVVSGVARRRLTSTSQLTKGQATAVIDTLIRVKETDDPADYLDWIVRQGWEQIEMLEATDGHPTLWETDPPTDTEETHD